MKQLIKDIEKLVLEEYDRATEKFGATFNGPHEAYAVMLEEYQEAREAMETCGLLLDMYWAQVRKNHSNRNELESIAAAALHTTAECVQLAAMAHKAIISMEQKAADARAESEAPAAALLPAT